jgi:hypothetical protein
LAALILVFLFGHAGRDLSEMAATAPVKTTTSATTTEPAHDQNSIVFDGCRSFQRCWIDLFCGFAIFLPS